MPLPMGRLGAEYVDLGGSRGVFVITEEEEELIPPDDMLLLPMPLLENNHRSVMHLLDLNS